MSGEDFFHAENFFFCFLFFVFCFFSCIKILFRNIAFNTLQYLLTNCANILAVITYATLYYIAFTH